MREAGGAVIGLDWRVPLAEAGAASGDDRGVQGNLDPAALFAPRGEVERGCGRFWPQAAGRPGHIFNLGHGLLPETPLENVQALVDTVRHYESSGVQDDA